MKERLAEQSINRSWGGHLEIAAMSDLYQAGILIWQLSRSGELTSISNNPSMTGVKVLRNLYLVRHRDVHYNCAILKNPALSLVLPENLCLNGEGENSRARDCPNEYISE